MPELEVNPAAEKSLVAYQPAPVMREEHGEDRLTRLIEQQAAKVPSAWFLIAAFAALGLSFAFELAGRERWSKLAGLWAPTLLITGLYNKVVKSLGAR